MKDDEATYDDMAALVRHRTKATAVLVFVIDGKRGSGQAVNVRGGSLTEADKDKLMLDIVRVHASKAEQRAKGVEPRGVLPATGEVKGLPKLHEHSSPNDDPEQAHLRGPVADEIEAVCKKYDVGGVLLLVSKTSASWRSVFPSWCGLQPDPVHVLRLRMNSRTPEAKENADSTMHFIATVREMCSDYANFYGRLWRQAVDAIKAQGGAVEHAPHGGGKGVGGRPDPMGGGVE